MPTTDDTTGRQPAVDPARVATIAQALAGLVNGLTRLDAAVALLADDQAVDGLLPGEDFYRLDTGARMVRVLIDDLSDQVDALGARR